MRNLAFLVVLAACTAGPSSPPDPASTPPEATQRTVPPPAAPSSALPEPSPPPSDPADLASVEVHVVPIGPSTAEDGVGGQLESQAAVAIDLETAGWPGRAMDPVLEVGALRFTDYAHRSPTLLRFVAADASLVPAGARAVVRYGDDVVAELILPPAESP